MTGNKLTLPAPPPGILRTSSPLSSSSPGDTGSGADRDSGSDKCRHTDSGSERGRYNVRSDTVLEMCSDIEDISFIDEDPNDEICEIHENDSEQQQFVIKLNNEIELTSIVVNTGSRSQSVQENKTENDENVATKTRLDSVDPQLAPTQLPTYDEISETSFSMSCDVSLVAPEVTSSSSSRETVSSRHSAEAPSVISDTKAQNCNRSEKLINKHKDFLVINKR